MKEANIVLFDMDNTLLLGDSVGLWAEFLDEKGMMTAYDWERRRQFDEDYIEHRLDVDASFEFELGLLKRVPVEKRQEWRVEFFERMVKSKISSIGLQLIQEYKAISNTVVVLITATHHFLAFPIAQYAKVHHLIATAEEMKDGDYTGRVLGIVNMGEGKVRNFQIWLKENNIKPAHTKLYSDSINDLPLLLQVDKPIVVDPDSRLRAVALQRNWEIMSFRSEENKAKQKMSVEKSFIRVLA